MTSTRLPENEDSAPMGSFHSGLPEDEPLVRCTGILQVDLSRQRIVFRHQFIPHRKKGTELFTVEKPGGIVGFVVPARKDDLQDAP